MYKVLAFQVADSIDVKNFKAAFTGEIYHSDADELFYRIEADKFIYIFRYGVVSFLNHNEVESSAFLQLITPFCRTLLTPRLSDEFVVETDSVKFDFGFNKIGIPESDPDMLRLIMLHVSQSVALDHFEAQTSKLLTETYHHTQVLEIKGTLDLRGVNLKRYIGRTLNLKNRIAENLYIFDSPEETWENENLNKLDLGLKKTFDLQARFRNIEERLSIVRENLDLFKDLLQYRNSTALEWIIIILIAVEVVNLFLEKFMGI